MQFINLIQKMLCQYSVHIENKYKELDHEVFAATFDVEIIQEVLNIFKEGIPFKYEINDSQIIISPTNNNKQPIK